MKAFVRAMLLASVLAAGCGKDKGSGGGKAEPVPVAVQVPADAAAAVAAATIDAAPADPWLVSQDGVGAIGRFEGVADDDEASMAALRRRLAGTGLEVQFEVMDVGGEVETEEGYYSLREGGQEVAQVMRTEPFMRVHAVSPRFHTRDGIKVGDDLPALLAKRTAAACQVRTAEPLGLITCRSPDEPDVVFVLEASCWQGEPPPEGQPVDTHKLGPCRIIELVR